MMNDDMHQEDKKSPAIKTSLIVFAGIFGVFLPTVTLVLELATGMCAEMYIDPIPTWFYTFLVAVVPIANLWAIIALAGKRAQYLRELTLVNSVAIGISIFYSLVFLPMCPVAVVGIIWFGIGLLPLSPLISLIIAIKLRREIHKVLVPCNPEASITSCWKGIVAIPLVVMIMSIPLTLTVIGCQIAQSDKKETRLKGIEMLRSFGHDKTLLNMCYSQQAFASDPIGFVLTQWLVPITTDDARKTYYRVTGEPFNSSKPPSYRMTRMGWRGSRDGGLGGESVADRISGLTLKESRMDVSMEADAATAYTEWTMVFHNTTRQQQEARAQIHLPSGGVVSRLTLWIDGEEREAAFGGKSQVRKAYQAVVRRRRDPVLVNVAGKDRVLVQCFPVPPSGGTMKIRVGITSPLAVQALDKAMLTIPYFTERNFSMSPELHPALWAESARELTTLEPNLVCEQPEKDLYAIRGDVSEESLDRAVSVQTQRKADAFSSWARNRHGKGIVQQVIKQEPVIPPARLVLVIDGSKGMEDFEEKLKELSAMIPSDQNFAILLASDEVEELRPLGKNSQGSEEAMDKTLRSIDFVGGCNNVPAISRAWDIATQEPNSVILWIHDVQPVDLGGIEPLRQKWDRRPNGPMLYDLQLQSGPNIVNNKLLDMEVIRNVKVSNQPMKDLENLMQAWSGKAMANVFERQMLSGQTEPQGIETTDHVVRLWAFSEIVQKAKDKGSYNDAVKMAVKHQLVTSVSGAVVLETQAQYNAAKLKPVDPKSVPTMGSPGIPEPETWAMIIIVIAVFLLLLGKKLMRNRRDGFAMG